MATKDELLAEARRLLFHVQPDYCDANCPPDKSLHEATCAEVAEWLDAVEPVLGPVPAGWEKKT